MENNEIIDNKIDLAIREHIHDGNFAQRINLFDIFGNIQTVTSVPTATPSNIFGQFQIYNSLFYFYDFLNNVWLSSFSTASFNSINKFVTAKFDHYVDVNNANTSETDLYSDTLAAGLLATNGDKISARYQGIFTGAVAATQDLRAYFGGTKIYDSGALSIGAITSNWTLEILIIRVSSSVVRCSVSVNSDFATLFPYSTYTEVTGLTLANTQILKITGQAGGASGASNQVTAKLGSVSYQPSA